MLVAAESGTSRVLVSSDQLGEGLTEIGLPLWSRDGTRIAFTAFIANADAPHAFVVDADGTNLVDLGDGSLIQWSPDGEWLLVEPTNGRRLAPSCGSCTPMGATHGHSGPSIPVVRRRLVSAR